MAFAGAGLAALTQLVVSSAQAAPSSVTVIVPRFLEVSGPAGAVAAQVMRGGEPAPDGTSVTFSGSLGLSFSPVVAHTSAGLAESTVFAGSEAGFARIDASAGVERASTTIWVRSGAPHTAVITASPPTSAPGASIYLTGRVEDSYGNPVDGAEAIWWAEGGSVTPAIGYVERGETAATLTVGNGTVVTAGLTAGDATAEVVVPIATDERPTRLFVPFASTRTNACENLVRNPGFAEDRDADQLPDFWRIAPGEGTAQVVEAGPNRAGHALRMTAPHEGQAPEAIQAWDLRKGFAAALVRVWARGEVGASLRLDVWSMGDVGGRITRLPILVETVPVAADWQLHVFALPIAPTGATEVRLSPRGAGVAVDATGIGLEVCP